MRKKRKYTRRPMTTDRIVRTITSIRTRNNKQWMALLGLAFKAKPRQAKKIMSAIVENDRQVTKWMSKLGGKN